MGFSVSRQEIERTIFEFIRLRAVDLGYLADVALFQPSSPANKLAFEAANQLIVAGGKEIIEPFGVSSAERRGEKRINKIWVNLRQLNTGTVSLWGESVEPSGALPGTFQRTFFATSTSTIIYDIRSSTESVEYDRICTQIIMQGLTASRVGQALPIVLNDGSIDGSRWILVRLVNATDIRQPQFFERLYTYEIQDVYIDDWGYEPYQINIPPISEVDTNAIIDNSTITLLTTT